MKKILKLFLVVIFILSTTSCTKIKLSFNEKINVATESVIEKSKYGNIVEPLIGEVDTLSKYELPKTNDTIHGFNVDAIYDFEERNAKLVFFTHEKSGAKVVLISNDDEDKATAFGFNTTTYDDKGIPHVFEHASLGGSRKYPNANLWDEATSKTYNTYMNASTFQTVTSYTCSSLSDSQLFELYKLYMDGVMDANILREEKNLQREAYRYSLHDKNDDIELGGIVYSEMAGNEGNINRAAYQNSLKTMFEGSYLGVNVGGETDDIIKISHDELVNFHEKYYHPSNMIIVLYGDIDYEKYLSYSNEEYLSKYNKKEITIEDDKYIKKDKFEVKKFDFPISNDDEVDGKSIISYNVLCEDLNAYEKGLFRAIINALNKSDGPIEKRLLEKLPNADYIVENCLYFQIPYFKVSFANVNEDDSDILKKIVEEAFNEIVTNGINKEVIDEIVDEIEVEKEVSKDSHGFADIMMEYHISLFNDKNDMISNLREQKGLEDIKEAYEKGDINNLIKKYLANNNATMTLTVPKKGLLEEKNQKRINYLKELKASMTDYELEQLVTKTIEFEKWQEEQSKESLINKIRVASVSSLDEYRAKCYAYEENIEGVRFIRSDIEDANINNFSLYFDASGLKFEEILKFKFATELLFELPTKNYEGKKISSEFERYTSYFDIGPVVNHYYDGGYKPYYSISIRSLDKNLDKIFELIKELMYETEFYDINIVKKVASSNLNDVKSNMLNYPTDFATIPLLAQSDDDYLYQNYMSCSDYLQFLKDVNNMSNEELTNLLKECREILFSLYNRNGFTCNIVANFDTIKNIKSKVIELSYNFDDERITSVNYNENLERLKSKIAYVCNGTIEYNYITLPLQKEGIKYTSKLDVLGNILDAKILFQEFRAKRSAYGSYFSAGKDMMYIYTYRDPNLKETYEVFKEIPKLLKELKIEKDELEDFKLSAYSRFSYPLTKLESAIIAVNETFSKTNEKRPDRYVRYMKEIKETKLEDLPKLYEYIDVLISNGNWFTIGGKEKIDENASLFESINYDYLK